MKLVLDNHNLLSIEHPDLPQLKEYTYEVSGWKFSDWDKGMIVLHKKDFKIVNLKNLGDGMSVVWSQTAREQAPLFGNVAFQQAFGLFSGFDEVSGQVKYFFPNARDFTDFVMPVPCDWKFSSSEEILSFLYGLTLLYGKFESKSKELLSLKIQVPLFGQYLKYQENLDRLVIQLQQGGFFLKTDVLDTNNGVIYQMSSNDWELLEIFAKWHQSIENFEKITRKDFTQQMKQKLLDFLQHDPQVPEEGKVSVLASIEKGVLKFLVKG